MKSCAFASLHGRVAAERALKQPPFSANDNPRASLLAAPRGAQAWWLAALPAPQPTPAPRTAQARAASPRRLLHIRKRGHLFRRQPILLLKPIQDVPAPPHGRSSRGAEHREARRIPPTSSPARWRQAASQHFMHTARRRRAGRLPGAAPHLRMLRAYSTGSWLTSATRCFSHLRSYSPTGRSSISTRPARHGRDRQGGGKIELRGRGRLLLLASAASSEQPETDDSPLSTVVCAPGCAAPTCSPHPHAPHPPHPHAPHPPPARRTAPPA